MWTHLHRALWLGCLGALTAWLDESCFAHGLKCIGLSEGCGCVFDDGSGTIDVSSLANTDGTPRFKDVDGAKNESYSYNPCQPFKEGDCSHAAVCRVSADGSTFTKTGDAGTGNWYHDVPVPGSNQSSVTVVYQHRVSEALLRQSYVTYLCNESATEPTFVSTGGDGVGTYYFQLTSECACANTCSGSAGSAGNRGLSAGSVLLIIFFATLTLYLASGVMVKMAKGSASGLDLLPHITFWRSVPGYVKDGFMLLTCRYDARAKEIYTEVS